jgi:tRNA threonylcarbamoyladenosine biosynthesis protein TsaE
MIKQLKDEQDSIAFAQAFAEYLKAHDAFKHGLVIYLHGDLGAGKTFFARHFIQSFLPGIKVKSPTYTVVESYKFSNKSIHHFDLYRLCDPEELEYLAVRDLLAQEHIALIEWPQKGQPLVPAADIKLRFDYLELDKKVVRQVDLELMTEKAKSLFWQFEL